MWRQKLRDKLGGMNDAEYAAAIEAARQEALELSPPHRTYEEWKAMQAAHQAESERSRDRVRQAQIALQNGHASPIEAQEAENKLLKKADAWPDNGRRSAR